ncbi:MAG: hypothetical protein ABI596_13095 [Pyrinomonadaceae bacterium]
MNKIVRMHAVVATLALVTLSLAGCGGGSTTPSTPAPTTTAVPFPCPALPSMFRTGCPGVDLTGMTLTCAGGAPSMTTGPIPPPSGGTRIGVTIPNGSTIAASINPVGPDPLHPNNCMAVGPSVPLAVTFGVAYVGDLGSVAAAPGVTAIPFCISRSKATFSQFASPDPLITIFQDPLKGLLHLELDRQVIEKLSGAPAPTPRCPFWRQMP